MTTQNENSPTQLKKTARSKGPFRTEAVVPFLVVVAAVFLYFHFLFDHNLKSALEYVGYEVVGAEVDIASIETSFWRASFRAQGIELTNAEKNEFDVIKIGDVRYSLLWDALLRARFVANEMAVEQIEFNVPRKSPGKVKPPEPPKPKSTKPSEVEKEAGKFKDSALGEVQNEYSDNALGDIAGLLKGGAAGGEIGDLSKSFPSKAKLDELQKSFQEKQSKWNEKLKTLPQGPEIQALGDRLKNVKTSGFKSPQEFQKSAQEIASILQEGDSKIKKVQGLSDDFNKDMKEMDSRYKEVDALVKQDVAGLQSRLKIPKIDAKSLSRAIFISYLRPYLGMFYKYQKMFEKYFPPKTPAEQAAEKKEAVATAKADAQFKPHPRAKGVTYEFGRANSYPLFWVRRISVSSQAGATKESGNIKGLITDVTSNQELVGKPTVAHFSGNFPAMEIEGFALDGSFDDRGEQSVVDFSSSVGSYVMNDKQLINSPDAKVSFKKATGDLQIKGSLVALKNFKFDLQNKFQKIDFQTSAQNEVLASILEGTFKELPVITLSAKGEGELPTPNLDVESNIGTELQKGFEKQVQKKIDEAKQKLQAAIDSVIGKQRAAVEGQMNGLKSQVDGATKKVDDQINAQKTQAQNKMGQSSKGAAKQSLDKLKGALGL